MRSGTLGILGVLRVHRLGRKIKEPSPRVSFAHLSLQKLGEGHRVGPLEADSLSFKSLLPSLLLATCGVMAPSSGLNHALNTYCICKASCSDLT